MTKNAQKMFLIDGSALAYRSYFAFVNNPLINSKGEHTGAVYGLTRFLMRIIEEEAPEYLVVVFDTPKKTFRHKVYTEYKGTRKPMPENMSAQLPRMREMIAAFGIPIIEALFSRTPVITSNNDCSRNINQIILNLQMHFILEIIPKYWRSRYAFMCLLLTRLAERKKQENSEYRLILLWTIQVF